LKIWLGHFVDNTKEWFIAWARDIRELVLMIDGVIGEPDQRSLRQLLTPGFANCHVHFSSDGHPSFSLVKDKTLRENWLHIEGNVRRAENAFEHIQRVAKRSKKDNATYRKIKIWLGTYEHKNKTSGEDCFIVWAASKQEAIELVSVKTEKSFEKHLRPLLKAGYINIHVGFKSGQMTLTPPKEDVESGLWIYMDDFE
jgi:hypothetical protein